MLSYPSVLHRCEGSDLGGCPQDPRSTHGAPIAVRSYDILPISITNLFALVLAWAEFCTGVLLILGVFTRQAAGGLLLMLVMFVAALAAVVARGMAIDCGCFTSDGGSSVNIVLIIKDILMAVACIIIMRFDRGWMSLGSRYQPATN